MSCDKNTVGTFREQSQLHNSCYKPASLAFDCDYTSMAVHV